MDYAIKFGDQLKPQLRALRKARGLTQTELGVRLGVTQRRIAEIEANPGVVAIDQIIRICAALGADLVLRDLSPVPTPPPSPPLPAVIADDTPGPHEFRVAPPASARQLIAALQGDPRRSPEALLARVDEAAELDDLPPRERTRLISALAQALQVPARLLERRLAEAPASTDEPVDRPVAPIHAQWARALPIAPEALRQAIRSTMADRHVPVGLGAPAVQGHLVSELGLWMNGERVGAWSRTRGSDALTYDPAWRQSPHGRPLSLSLPFTATGRIVGDAVGHYFDNLLPDARSIRDRMGRRFGVKANDTFELLSAIGRDCVGAVQLLPPGRTPEASSPPRYEVIDESRIERILVDTVGDSAIRTGADDDDAFRISLAGAQEKTALLRIGEQWCLPHGATPTTHILKLPLGLVGGLRADMSDSVENEWLCLRLLDRMGLPAARTEILTFGERKTLCVERFDREWRDDGTWIARLPQEDFCQATGTPPAKKYQRDGGPGIATCMNLLAGSRDPLLDRSRFLLSQLAFWMLGATDGHAKNFSIFLQPGGDYVLTPLYDVLSAYPILGRGKGQLPRQKAHLAMPVRGKSAHSQLDHVKTQHWIDEARRSGVPDMLDAMIWLATSVPDVIRWAAAELPENFPEHVWGSITTGLAEASQRFLEGLDDTA